MTWQEKNLAGGLAALLVLIVMAHLTFGSSATGEASAPATAPAPEPVAQSPAPGPPETPVPGAEGR